MSLEKILRQKVVDKSRILTSLYKNVYLINMCFGKGVKSQLEILAETMLWIFLLFTAITFLLLFEEMIIA